jgi:hypothetical protein
VLAGQLIHVPPVPSRVWMDAKNLQNLVDWINRFIGKKAHGWRLRSAPGLDGVDGWMGLLKRWGQYTASCPA